MPLTLTNESKQLIQYYRKFNKRKNGMNGEKYLSLQRRIFALSKEKEKEKEKKIISSSNTKDNVNPIETLYAKHLHNNRFVAQTVKDYIRNSAHTFQQFKIPYKEMFIIVNLFLYEDESEDKSEEINEILHLIYKAVYIVDMLTMSACSNKGLEINLFLTPFKRTIKTVGDGCLGADNANGGFCYGCVAKGVITIYRHEEWFKVLCHELIHNYGVDASIFEFMEKKDERSLQIYRDFIGKFSIGNNIHFDFGIQECLVEFWGEFINTAIYSSSKVTSFPDYLATFDSLYGLEALHAMAQTGKILKHNGMTFAELVNIQMNRKKQTKKIKKKTIKQTKTIKTKVAYKEETHIFSYYILKLFLIYDYKGFVEQYLVNSSNIVLPSTNEAISRFFHYIIGKTHDPALYKDYLRVNKPRSMSRFIRETMCMSTIQVRLCMS